MTTTLRETGPRTTAPTIGFVGLGHMGGAMAARLLAAGHPVVGTQRSRAGAEELLAHGLRWEDTPRDVALAAEVVITSVPDDDALSAVASGPDGVLSGLGAGTTWLEMNTVNPTVKRELAGEARTRCATMLDSPVSGTVPQAQAGTLKVMLGGDAGSYGRADPVQLALG